jgi:hypothetical protein
MGDWKPDNMGKVEKMKLYYHPSIPYEKDTYFYYWVIPANAEGVWRWTLSTPSGIRDYTLRLAQKFQEIHGAVHVKGQEAPIADAHLVGDQLSFTLSEDTNKGKVVIRFNGRINGDGITGNVEVQGGPSTGSYPWTAKRQSFLPTSNQKGPAG